MNAVFMVAIDTVTSSWVPCHMLETFDCNLAGPILESMDESSINPALTNAWEAALDWEQDLNFWKEKLYRLRDEKQKRQSPSAVHSGSVLQMRKRNESPKCRYLLRSTVKVKRTFDEVEDKKDARTAFNVKSTQKHGRTNSSINRKVGTQEAIKQSTGLME